MPNYRLTLDAQSDLIDIRRFTLKKWGEGQSKNYLSDLKNTIQMLAQTPLAGKHRPEVAKHVYSFPCASHIIYYVVHQQQLVVFGILHQRMVPVKHLADRKSK